MFYPMNNDKVKIKQVHCCELLSVCSIHKSEKNKIIIINIKFI